MSETKPDTDDQKMIEKESPEGQFRTVIWRTILSMAEPVSEQYRWMLTGIAAILGLMVANLDSIQKVVCNANLKASITLLVTAVVLASIAFLLSIALKLRNEVIKRLEETLETEVVQTVRAQMRINQSELSNQLSQPFFGPLRWIMKRSFEKGSNDPFATEKGGIVLIVWQAYAMWISIVLAAVGLVVLVAGLE